MNKQRSWILNVPFEDRNIVSKYGARWDKQTRAFVYRGDDLPTGLTPYASQPYSWERWIEDDLNGFIAKNPKPAEQFTPRKHQNEAANLILKACKARARGFLLADDVGLGKTITAIEGVKRIKAENLRRANTILVVAPLAVVPHWRRTLLDMNLGSTRICVINYDRLKKLLSIPKSAKTAKRTKTKNKRIASQGKSLVDWDIVILDEAHLLRHSTSQRSQAVATIAKYGVPQTKAPFVIWMSATAGQNPTELSYLAPLLAQITRSNSGALKDFGPWLQTQGFHVTEDLRWKKWEWTEDPSKRAEDIKRMRTLMFTPRTPVAARRLPTDIAGWPEVTRNLTPVELDPLGWRLYNAAWTEFRSEMSLVMRGKNPTGGMVARLRFRQKASLIRTTGTVGQIMNLLDSEMQVAVSCQFLESLDTILEVLEKKNISVAVMDGRTPSVREEQRLKFQRGDAKVCLFTPTAGFSLHEGELLEDGSHASSARRALIVHDPRYSGIEALQVEGRTHRDGKAAPVYYCYSSNTVEEEVVRVLLDRLESTKALVGDDVTLIERLTQLLDNLAG